jgi:hypothetical protein
MRRPERRHEGAVVLQLGVTPQRRASLARFILDNL